MTASHPTIDSPEPAPGTVAPPDDSPWPHRVAIVLACAVFPLIWVGGLVTTTDAGMAVPDWPTTYGYNMFLYPWQTWLYGPWDLFIEHGHRLLGSLAGLLAIGLVAVVWRCDRRISMRALAVGVLLAVIGQGVLGGMRVLLNSRDLAMLHGITGPAFFALCVVAAVISSRAWRRGSLGSNGGQGLAIFPIAAVTLVLAFSQIVLGALVRHVPASADSGTFRVRLFFHLAVAAALVVQALVLTARTWRRSTAGPALSRGSGLLLVLLVIQLALGSATWIARHGWPAWTHGYRGAAAYTIQIGGSFETHVITAHVATGALILAACTWIALEACRQQFLVTSASLACRRADASQPETRAQALAENPRRSGMQPGLEVTA